jgi:hypothetical protein
MFIPPAVQVLTASKIETIEHLDYIAARFTKTPRPPTTVIDFPVSNAALQQLQSMVLKRGYSDCTKHVLIQPKMTQISKLHQQILPFPRCVWFSQPYIPHLKEVGEWRVIIVNGQILSTNYTHPSPNGPGQLDWRPMDPPFTLQALQYVYILIYISVFISSNSRNTNIDAMHNLIYTTTDISTRKEATDELHQYAMTTWKHLVQIENRRFGIKNSTLKVYCRLDISFMPDTDGKLKYFVNEVGRSSTLVLWMNEVSKVNYETFCNHFKQGLRQWYNG